MGGAIAASSGPVLGGLLTLVSWRFIFVINVPVGAAALLLLARTMPFPHWKAPFDWFGQATAVVAMGALTFGAIEAGAAGPAAPRVVIAFVVTLVALIAFVAAQARGALPMVPPRMFRHDNVIVANTIGFAFMVGYFGLPFVMSLYLQQVRGLSSLATGLAFLPMMLTGACLTPFSARLVERLGARTLITAGLILMTAGLVIVAILPSSTSVSPQSGLTVPVGLAEPFVSPPATAVLLNSAPARQAGTASDVFNTSRQVGGALAVAVFGALLAQPAALMQGVRTSPLLAAGIALATAAASLLLRRSGGAALASAVRHPGSGSARSCGAHRPRTSDGKHVCSSLGVEATRPERVQA